MQCKGRGEGGGLGKEYIYGKGSYMRSRTAHGGVAVGKRSLVVPGQMSETKGLWGKELQEMDRDSGG